jgi:hypothetical protein
MKDPPVPIITEGQRVEAVPRVTELSAVTAEKHTGVSNDAHVAAVALTSKWFAEFMYQLPVVPPVWII